MSINGDDPTEGMLLDEDDEQGIGEEDVSTTDTITALIAQIVKDEDLTSKEKLDELYIIEGALESAIEEVEDSDDEDELKGNSQHHDDAEEEEDEEDED